MNIYGDQMKEFTTAKQRRSCVIQQVIVLGVLDEHLIITVINEFWE